MSRTHHEFQIKTAIKGATTDWHELTAHMQRLKNPKSDKDKRWAVRVEIKPPMSRRGMVYKKDNFEVRTSGGSYETPREVNKWICQMFTKMTKCKKDVFMYLETWNYVE